MKYPSAYLYRVELAATLERLGALAERAGRHQDAEQAIRQALELETRVLADDPAISRCCEQLLASVLGLAKILEDAGRTRRQRIPIGWASRQRRSFCFSSQRQSGAARSWAAFTITYGLFLARENRLQDAEQAHRRALDIYEKLSSLILGPSDRWRRQELMWTHENLGLLLNNSGRPRKLRKSFVRQSRWVKRLNTISLIKAT